MPIWKRQPWNMATYDFHRSMMWSLPQSYLLDTLHKAHETHVKFLGQNKIFSKIFILFFFPSYILSVILTHFFGKL